MTDHEPVEQPNPWTYETTDFQGRKLSIRVNWSASDRDLLSAVVYREPGCLYKYIYIGLPDGGGIPNDTPDQWGPIPEGETLVRANQLKKARLRTIDDIVARQITAGPGPE